MATAELACPACGESGVEPHDCPLCGESFCDDCHYPADHDCSLTKRDRETGESDGWEPLYVFAAKAAGLAVLITLLTSLGGTEGSGPGYFIGSFFGAFVISVLLMAFWGWLQDLGG